LEGWLDTSITAITLIIMLIGLFGLVIPIFPGIFVIWLAALGYGAVTGFSTLGVVLFVLITLLMVIGIVIDNFLMGVEHARAVLPGSRLGWLFWLALSERSFFHLLAALSPRRLPFFYSSFCASKTCAMPGWHFGA